MIELIYNVQFVNEQLFHILYFIFRSLSELYVHIEFEFQELENFVLLNVMVLVKNDRVLSMHVISGLF